jgi:hypothetical protein
MTIKIKINLTKGEKTIKPKQKGVEKKTLTEDNKKEGTEDQGSGI